MATGTGQLDLILYTHSTGTQNLGINILSGSTPTTMNFEDPSYDVTGNTDHVYVGDWGSGTKVGTESSVPTNGPVTVGNILDYLHYLNPDNNTPVFCLDLDQTGASPDLAFVGRVYLAEASAPTTPVIEWAFDTAAQGTGIDDTDPLYNRGPADADSPGFSEIGYFDATAWAKAIAFGGGSGKMDYITFAPTMDLSKYSRDLLFVTEFHMGNELFPLNNGPEEIFLTGRIGIPQAPEPASLLLLGVGMVGLAGIRRKFQK